jgi:sulfite reductase beta subunit-like hemoprotein
MSGCPNGCSQHHIANIGLYGASMKIGDRHLPAYIAHVGGQYEGGTVKLAKRLKVRLPARRVPDAIERWVRFYEQKRNEGESFNEFVERTDEKEIEGVVKDLAMPVEFNVENMAHFIDWERKEPYKVERGEGECAV